MFHAVTSNETLAQSAQATPDLYRLALPLVVALVLLEAAAGWRQVREKPLHHFGDTLTSLGTALLQASCKALTRGAELSLYAGVYGAHRLVDLPEDDVWTWLLGFLTVDLGYYWFHRLSHETLVGWSVHQVHHSSDFYNLSTALRQNAVQGLFGVAFYLPAALFLPPSVHLAQLYLTLLYQIWLHTQLVGRLGPLEWVLNTPSHHRVHHGRNPYCIDRNYGGTLIVWDRLFGTFAEERAEEEIAFGLVTRVESFSPAKLQTVYLPAIVSLTRERHRTHGWAKALQTPFRSPSWLGGDYPLVEAPVQRFAPPSSNGAKAYAIAHFAVAAWLLSRLEEADSLAVQLTPLALLAATLQWLGWLLEGHRWAQPSEPLRLVAVWAYVAVAVPLGPAALALHGLHAASLLWCLGRGQRGGEKEA